MKLSIQTQTDIGSRRTNFDAFWCEEALGLFGVADGFGGIAEDGTLASELGLETVAKYLREQHSTDWPIQLNQKSKDFAATQLRAACKLANHVVVQKTIYEEHDWNGFGASVAVLWLLETQAFIAHLGDCRVYRMRGNEIEQITEDHSLLNDCIKMGKMTPEEIENFPHKNVITRCLGQEKEPMVEVLREKVSPGDLYLLCTDGIHDNLTNKQITEILSQQELSTMCEQLFERAHQRERTDNSTAILIRCE